MRNKREIKKEELLFLAMLKELLHGGHKQELINIISQNKIDWLCFKNLLVYHELFPFAYGIFKDLPVMLPQELKDFLKDNFYAALLRSQNIWKDFLKILEAFVQANVTLLPLKGTAFLEDIYCSNPARLMTDIDLLVRQEDFPRAETILVDLGYIKNLEGLKEEYWLNKQYHIVFHQKKKELSIVELHWALDYKRENQSLFPELWQRIRQIDVGAKKIKLLSAEDSFLSLALHNRRFGKTLCLKNIYDSALLLEKYAASFDWQYVLEQSRIYKLCATVFFILYQVDFTFNPAIPQEVWSLLELPAWKRKLIQQFIEKNTFLLGARNLYLKSHFLLYDSLWEPVEYILNIPQEQFARFYNLKPYTKKTEFLYNFRFFYILFKAFPLLIYKDKYAFNG